MTSKRNVLITGATSGIGEALVYQLAERGYEVIACGRNEQKLNALSSVSNVQTVGFDATDSEACNSALAETAADIIILNAGTCEYVDVESLDPALFQRVFDINVVATINVLAAVQHQLTRGSTVVFVDSLARLLPFTRSQAYGASKAALHYMAKSFAVDFHSMGVKVQTISPGFVETPLTDKNDFDMPFKITAQQAASSIIQGIETGKSSIYFPTKFAWMLRLLGMLPESLKQRMCLSMKKTK